MLIIIIRQISIDYTLRRLAAKCANKHIIERRSNKLNPFQLSMGIAGGAEAAVHAIWRLTDDLSDDNVLVKLDFVNAFNTVWRDTILDTMADKAPEIYKFVLASHSCESKLAFGPYTILSWEGSQQGDPLSALEYCDAAQPTLLKSKSQTKLGYMDDLKLKGKIHVIASDIDMIVADAARTGLQLNPAKCEIIAVNFNEVEKYPIFKDFKWIRKEDLTILGTRSWKARLLTRR